MPDDRTGELLDETFGTSGYFRDHAPLVRKERIPRAARDLAESESTAHTIRINEPCLITGLFQIEAYIRAMAETGRYTDDIEDRRPAAAQAGDPGPAETTPPARGHR